MRHAARNTAAAVVLAAVLSAGVGFAFHVLAAEVIERQVAAIMAGRQVTPSWDVRIPAALSAIEQGLALALLYLLLRARLPGLGSIRRGVVGGLLALALAGRLIRQPMMDLLIGNPITVVAMQDGLAWITWLAMGVITAICLDRALPVSD